MSLFKPHRLDIDERGLAKVLGSLEADIVNFLWTNGSATARIVCDYLNTKRMISFNAVNTVLGRLVEKGIVLREKQGSWYQFTARWSREELFRSVSKQVLSSLVKDRKMFSVAAFAEALQDFSAEEKKDLLYALQHGD